MRLGFSISLDASVSRWRSKRTQLSSLTFDHICFHVVPLTSAHLCNNRSHWLRVCRALVGAEGNVPMSLFSSLSSLCVCACRGSSYSPDKWLCCMFVCKLLKKNPTTNLAVISFISYTLRLPLYLFSMSFSLLVYNILHLHFISQIKDETSQWLQSSQ